MATARFFPEIAQEAFAQAETCVRLACERNHLPTPDVSRPGSPWTADTWYAAWFEAARTARQAAGEAAGSGNIAEAMPFYRLAALCYRAAGRFLAQEPWDPRNALCEAGNLACLRAAAVSERNNETQP